MYTVGYAVNGRDACSDCGITINKGDVRWSVGMSEEASPGLFESFHLHCNYTPKDQTPKLTDVLGIDTLKRGDKNKVYKLFGSSEKEQRSKNASVKREIPEDATSNPKAKKAKETVSSKAKNSKTNKSELDMEVEIIKDSKCIHYDTSFQQVDPEQQRTIASMKISDMKDLLKRNNMLIGGNQTELRERVGDLFTHGRFPPCPLCAKGVLRLGDKPGTVRCGGYFDNDVSMRMSCKFEKPMSEVARLPMIRLEDEDPTLSNSGVDAKTSSKPVVNVDSSRFAGIDNMPPKNAVMLLVTVAREHNIALPDSDLDANRQTLSYLNRNKNADGKVNGPAAIQEMMDILGVKENTANTASTGSGNGGAKSGSRPAATVAANTIFSDLIEELAELESKAKEGENYKFKVRALKKAAIAIRGASFAIQSGNQVAKGKQKLEGVGKSTAGIIDEIVETGTVARVEELRGKY